MWLGNYAHQALHNRFFILIGVRYHKIAIFSVSKIQYIVLDLTPQPVQHSTHIYQTSGNKHLKPIWDLHQCQSFFRYPQKFCYLQRARLLGCLLCFEPNALSFCVLTTHNICRHVLQTKSQLYGTCLFSNHYYSDTGIVVVGPTIDQYKTCK